MEKSGKYQGISWDKKSGNPGVDIFGSERVGILGVYVYLTPPFPPTSVLTPNGDHKNVWQEGGTHPTGMLSGLLLIPKIKNDSN